MELIIASGYPSTYGTPEAEIRLADEKKWFPTTIDFRATASGSGGAAEAATFAKVIDLIAAEKVGSIHELGLVGHANEETFSMAGKVTTFPADVVFAKSTLANELDARGVAFYPFETLEPVLAFLETVPLPGAEHRLAAANRLDAK